MTILFVTSDCDYMEEPISFDEEMVCGMIKTNERTARVTTSIEYMPKSMLRWFTNPQLNHMHRETEENNLGDNR